MLNTSTYQELAGRNSLEARRCFWGFGNPPNLPRMPPSQSGYCRTNERHRLRTVGSIVSNREGAINATSLFQDEPRQSAIEENGFAVLSSCLDEVRVERLRDHLDETKHAQRNLLSIPTVCELAKSYTIAEMRRNSTVAWLSVLACVKPPSPAGSFAGIPR